MKNNKYDWIGITSSALCIIHCLAVPVLLFFSIKISESFESYLELDYLFLIISFFALWNTSKNMHSNSLKALLWVSFSTLSVSVILHDITFFSYLSWVAGSGLILGHYLNIRHAASCQVC